MHAHGINNSLPLLCLALSRRRVPAESKHYVLYLNLVCPWSIEQTSSAPGKGLEDIIELVKVGNDLGPQGWEFTGLDGTAEKDPLYGFMYLSELYFKANPDYKGRYTVPFIWTKKKETTVNNESSESSACLYTEIGHMLPAVRREKRRKVVVDSTTLTSYAPKSTP